MSKINYKPEQASVIACHNKNQLVSASAGSGKTTIMIQKIINLITKDKINIKDILVLTYTKASAEEMKQKLVSAIYEEVKNDHSLLKQIDDIETSDISTIHSFFQKVIKKYFMVLGINPNFELIDETSGAKLQNIAMEETLEQFQKEKPDELSELLEVYGTTRNTKKIKELVFEIYRFLLSVPDKKTWVEQTATSLYEKIDGSPAIKILNDELYFVSQHFVNVFRKLQTISENFDEPKYVKLTNAYLSSLECVKSQPECFFTNLQIWQNLPATRLNQNDDVIELYNQIKSTKEDLSAFAKKIKMWDFADKTALEKSLKEIGARAKSLCELATRFEKKYFELKIKNNVLDYDDLEKYMLILIENSEVCEALRNHYAKIFVDEYQDANRVQEKIIKAISRPNNRFMVGDVKQSIYGFRQAEPDIFLETLEEFENGGLSEVGYLNYNFRSHKLILNFVNLVFNKIMTPSTSKIDYGSTSMFKWDEVYKDVENQHIPTVEINIIQKPEKEKATEPTKMYSVLDTCEEKELYSDAKLEAFFVASKVASLLGKKIYVAKEKREREIDYKDITILLRSRGKYLDEFCGVITALGIPLYANTNSSLFDDGDVLLLHNILALSVNLNNDIALVSVMHSPFGNFTYNELAQIRLSGQSKSSFYECVISYQDNLGIQTKIQALKTLLTNFAFDCKNIGLYGAFNKIFRQTNYENFVLAKEDGLQKLEKIRKYVNSFLNNGFNFSPMEFLEFVEINKSQIKSPDYTGGENCVSITTIHSSKGLEYPVVIMANANQNFDKGPVSTELVLSQTLGLGLRDFNKTERLVKPSLALEAIKKFNKKRDFAEKLRLLYVALTRPQNHLIVVGTTQKGFSKNATDYHTLNQKSYLGLLVGAMSEEELEKINNGESFETDNYAVNIISGQTEPNFLKPEINTSLEVDNSVIKDIEDYLNFCPPVKPSVLETSVSAIREKFSHIESSSVEKADNATDIGNAYHLVMENIDFTAISSEQDVKNFLQTAEIENKHLVESSKIYNAINQIKSLNIQTYLKEHQFVLKDNIQEITGSKEDVCVRGVIDLLGLGKENVLVDYKFTTEKNIEIIKEKYKLQLRLYEKACNLAGLNISKKYLLLLNTGNLVEVK